MISCLANILNLFAVLYYGYNLKTYLKFKTNTLFLRNLMLSASAGMPKLFMYDT